MAQAGDSRSPKSKPPKGAGAGRAARGGGILGSALALLVLLAVIAGAAGGVTRAIVVAGEAGFPLDDAWIHVRLAQRAASGDGLHFNVGMPSAASTAPLWTLLLAVANRIGLGFPWASYICGVGASLLLAWSAGRFVSRTLGNDEAGAVTALLIVCTHPFPWSSISGMEPALAAALTLLTIDAASTARTGMAFVLASLAAMTRPELLILPPLIVVATAFRKWNRASLPLLALGMTAACAVPFLLNRLTTGQWIVGALASKLGKHGIIAALQAGSPGAIPAIVRDNVPAWIRMAGRALIDDNPVLLALALPGIVLLVRRGAYLLLIAMLGLGLAMATVAPIGGPEFQEQRYFVPVAVLVLVSGAAALGALGTVGGKAGRVMFILGTLAALAFSGLGTWRALERYAVQVKNVNEMQVVVARWLASTPQGPGLVATNDIGAIGALTSAPILDVTGLASPEIIPYLRQSPPPGGRNTGWRGSNEAALLTALRERRPNYVVIFPSWYPSLAAPGVLGAPVFRVDLKDNIICGDDTLLVFKPDWGPRPGSAPAAAPPPATTPASATGP